jgi:hypothetical protein
VKPCAAALPPFSSKAFAGFAFVCTLIGTIVSGAGDTSMYKIATGLKTEYDAYGATTATPAFGCSIAATIVQAIALGLAFLPAPAPAPALKLAAPPAAGAAAV